MQSSPCTYKIAKLVERHRHDSVGRVERLLDSVSVVDVDVDVEDASVELEQLQDAKHDVVHVAEAWRGGAQTRRGRRARGPRPCQIVRRGEDVSQPQTVAHSLLPIASVHLCIHLHVPDDSPFLAWCRPPLQLMAMSTRPWFSFIAPSAQGHTHARTRHVRRQG